jgi:hypothetical protein
MLAWLACASVSPADQTARTLSQSTAILCEAILTKIAEKPMQKMPKARIKYAARFFSCAAKGGVDVDVDVVMVNLEVDQVGIDYKLKRTAR